MKKIFVWRLKIFIIYLKIIELRIEQFFVNVYFGILIAIKKFQLSFVIWKYDIFMKGKRE